MIKSTQLQLETDLRGTRKQVTALSQERRQERAWWVPELQPRKTEFEIGRLLV